MKSIACRRLSLFALGLLLSLSVSADWGIFQSYIVLDTGAGNEFFAGSINSDGAQSFLNRNLGNFDPATDTFVLNGGELKTFKNGSSNVCGGSLFYRVVSTSGTPGAFSSVALPFNADLGGGDQRWQATAANVDLLAGLADGTYLLEVFWEAEGNLTNPGGCGEFVYDSNPGNDWKGYFSVGSVPSVIIDFEGASETKGSYATGTVNLSGYDWEMTEAMIGTLANDKKNGARSMRMRRDTTAAGEAFMLEDKTSGLGIISFYYARYGTEINQPALTVQYSTDAGVNWTNIGDPITDFPDQLTYWQESVNVGGDVRVRFITDVSGTNQRRINVDDIVLTDFCSPSACADILDSFDDGDFTAGPAWTGDTGSWTVVGSSDAAAGASCANALRLNAGGAGTSYLSTSFDTWELNQEWSLWFGRRAQALTAANSVAMWLYADNSDLTAATISGYRLFIGDNSGGDEFILQRVDNGVSTDLVSSAEITNGRTDFGVALRVTRSDAGDWELFTSTLPAANGDGVVATDCPATEATISQGVATDNTYSPSGTAHVGFVAVHSSGGNAIVAAEFDQFSIATNAVATSGCTDITACNYDASATVDDGSCEFLSCAGCTDAAATNYDASSTIDDGSCTFPAIILTEIHYNPNDGAGFTDLDYEFIEIYNLEPFSVDLSGWSITDGVTFTFPASTTIASGEYIVIARNAATYSGNGYQVFQFTGALANTGETINIETPAGNAVNTVSYSNTSPWPTDANGTGPSAELANLFFDNTDGANWISLTINGSPGGAPIIINGCTDPSATNYDVNATIEDGSCTYGPATIVISELHYNPCVTQGTDGEFEFLELHNASAATIDLSNWEITGFEYTFPLGSSIAAGEYIVIVQQGSAGNYTGNGYQVFELTNPAGLNNGGEAISVLDDIGNVIDYMEYETSSPWPTGANGGCSSLELIDPSADNTDPSNWQDSYTFGGTPGAPASIAGDCVDCGDALATVDSFLSDDFESGTLTGWMQSNAGEWEASTTTPIAGTYSLRHIGAAGSSSISYDMTALDADAACTTWSFDISSEDWDLSASNNFAVFLVANEADLTSATVDGYAVGADLSADANGRLALWQVVDGSVSNVIATYPYAWGQNESISFEISHTEAGDWVFKAAIGNAAMIAGANPVAALPDVEGRYFGIRFNSDASAAGKLRADNIGVEQCGLEETYYSVESGNITDAIWNTDTSALTGEAVTFTTYKNMVVRNGQNVTADVNTVVKNLTLDADNGAGTLNGASFTFEVAEDWTNNGGLFNADNSTVVFNGITAQNIAGSASTRFENITMDNALGLSLGVNTEVHGVLAPQSGAFTGGGNDLILVSDAAGTGSIGSIEAGASYAGNTVVERFIPAGFQNWVNLANPINGLTLADWNDDLITTGFPNSDFPWYGLNNVLTYDETVAGGLNDGFVGATDVTDALDAERGYFVFMQGASQHVSVAGSIQQGSLTTNLNYTSTGVAANDGWELVANRYPSEIDFEALYALSTNIGPTYYIYDAENAAYSTYTAGLGGTASGFIPSGQSFWVQTTAAGANLQFEESVKSATGTAFERNFLSVPRITLRVANEGREHFSTLAFDESASHAYEAGKDAFLLGSPVESAAQISLVAAGGEKTTVNRLAAPEGQVIIPVHIKASAPGSYTFNVASMELLPQGMCISIEDLTDGSIAELTEDLSYTWEQTEAFDGERFHLILSKPLSAEAVPTQCADSGDGKVLVDLWLNGGVVYLEDLEGNLIASAEANGEAIEFDGLAAGDYLVRYTGDDLLCESTELQVYVEETPISDPSIASTAATCNIPGTGIVEVSGFSGSFEVSFNGEVFVGEQALTLAGLDAGVYEITSSDQCLSESFTIDLSDGQALPQSIDAEELYAFVQGSATITAGYEAEGGAVVSWSVNGEEVATGNWLNHLVYETGSYTLSVSASNETCTAEVYQTVEVQEVVNIFEAEESELGLQTLPGTWVLSGSILEGEVTVELFSIDGRLIDRQQTRGNNRLEVPNSNLSSGIYLVRVSDATGKSLGTLRALR